KGMTLESVVELENGKMVMVSEFFNEDDPDFDHSLDQLMAINWSREWSKSGSSSLKNSLTITILPFSSSTTDSSVMPL
ncbi:hypothetical protein V7P28_45475, partial [Klebsiella michiganensis]